MKKTILAATTAIGLLIALQGSANATVLDFSYLGTADSGIAISGTLTTGAVDPSGSFFTPSVAVTGISGTFDGSSITGLLPAGTFYMTSGIFGSPGNDNILYYPGSQSFMGQTTYVDRYGLSFSTATDDVNLFFGLGGYGELQSPIGSSSVTSDIGGTFSVSAISAVPEPATWAMMLLGFGGIGYMLRSARRKRETSAVTA